VTLSPRIAVGALVAVGIAASGLLAGSGVLPVSGAAEPREALSTFPPAPQNLRAYEVGPDYAKVTYGPSIVGKFTSDPPIINARRTAGSMVIRWGAARDDLYPSGITYDFSKNGKLLWSGRAQLYATIGYTSSVRTFTTCVTPHSQSGYGPKRCTTWTANVT
jgi:hypothetical protein